MAASTAREVPADVEARLRAQVRRETGRPPGPGPQRLLWLAIGAGAAAVLVALVVGRPDRRTGEIDELARALEASASAEPRTRGGPGDDLGAALRAAAGEVRNRGYETRAARAEGCPSQDRARLGAFDGAGQLRVLLVPGPAGSELHLYRESGEEVAARRFAGGHWAAAEPLSRADAEAALTAPTCELLRGR